MERLEKLLNSMSIYIRRAWDTKMPEGWYLPPRYIFDYELLYVKEGALQLTIENETYEGREGDLFFIPPGRVHHIKSIYGERVRQPHVHFDFYFDDYSENLEIPLTMPKKGDIVRQDVINELLNVPYKMTFKSPLKVENLILSIIAEDSSDNPFKMIKQKALMFELLYLVFNYKNVNRENYGKENPLKIVTQANTFMQNNSDRALSTAEIAMAVGYSTNYFVEIYKSIAYISPIKYHEKLRMERAKNLLLSTSLSVSEISEMLGFNNLYAFSRFFKRSFGLSPTDYKKKHYNAND